MLANDLQKKAAAGGYLVTFCRKGEGLDLVLPRDTYGEPTRTFAKALMQVGAGLKVEVEGFAAHLT